MSTESNTTVRMFGALHAFRTERGLSSTIGVNIPPAGCTAHELAGELDLPMDKIEAVFVNHQVYSLDHAIHPGDRVAFVPTGIPGHVCLGLFKTNPHIHGKGPAASR